jgi:hypothetical protein
MVSVHVLIIAAVLLAAASLGASAEAVTLPAGSGPIPAREGAFPLRLIAYANGEVNKLASRFQWQDPGHPALRQLREREKLDAVVARGSTDFDKILALKGWTGAQWKFGTPRPYPPWNAVVILDGVRAGKHGGWCGQYAQVFAQALLSEGYRARYIELGPPGNPYGHFTTEVWVSDLGKWVVVDPTPLDDNDCYFVDGRGEPMSAREIHRAVVTGRAAEVRAIRADPLSPDVPPVAPAKIEVYYYLRYLWRTDQLSNNPPVVDMQHVFDRWNDSLEWEDAETVMWEDSRFAASWEQNQRQTAVRISRAEDVDWPLTDAVRLELRPMVHADGLIALGLWACQPNLRRFVVQIDGGEWAEPAIPEAARQEGLWGPGFYPITLSPGRHTVRARAQKTTGELGPISFVTFEFSAPPPAKEGGG